MSFTENYADQMAWYQRGWALYHPVRTSEIRIGDFGFFNKDGYWNRMGNIKDKASITRFNLTEFDVTLLDEVPVDNSLEWGPLHTQKTSGRAIQAGGQASGAPSGVPAGATFQVEYTSSTDFGAVLACLAPIRREAYYYSDPFKAWAQANMVALASGSLRDDIRENGFFIVTQTHATQKYTLTAWNEKNKSACIGFSVDVEGGAALKADSRWYEGRSVNGWETAQGDGTTKDLRVVFASGVFCRFKQSFWSTAVHMSTTLRSGEATSFDKRWEGKLPTRPPQEEEAEDL